MLQLRALLLKGVAVTRISFIHLALAALAAFAAPCWPLEAANVLTFHKDNNRTGRNLQETTLNTLNVNPNTFGKLFLVSLDGNSFGQPLYVASVNFKGGSTPEMRRKCTRCKPRERGKNSVGLRSFSGLISYT
jgi:hypothetical protein